MLHLHCSSGWKTNLLFKAHYVYDMKLSCMQLCFGTHWHNLVFVLCLLNNTGHLQFKKKTCKNVFWNIMYFQRHRGFLSGCRTMLLLPGSVMLSHRDKPFQTQTFQLNKVTNKLFFSSNSELPYESWQADLPSNYTSTHSSASCITSYCSHETMNTHIHRVIINYILSQTFLFVLECLFRHIWFLYVVADVSRWGKATLQRPRQNPVYVWSFG